MSPQRLRVRLSTGEIEGESRGEVDRFLGIPYAAPPFGERRFAEPQPPEAWSGVRDASSFGATPPQRPYQGRLQALLPTVAIAGEDVLTVNVWAPRDAQNLPVVFWLHGGAFERGTTALPLYDGTAFARDGVIFVSAGYRLGAEGFSVLEGAPRNLGLSDAAAALRWTHAEIAAFGGDPTRITVMGESAGGALAAALLARPDTAEIPAALIVQSGPLSADSPTKAGRVTAALAKRLGVSATVDDFRTLTPDQILDARQAQSAGSTPLRGAPGYLLCLDATSLPRSPEEALRDAQIPVLIGTNTDEYRLWFAPEALSRIRPFQLLLARLALGISRSAVRAYRREFPEATTGEIFGQLATDVLLRAPALRTASARTAPTSVYEFAWTTPLHDLCAAHALELGFVFDALQTDDAIRLAGPAAPHTLAEQMHGDWVRFILDVDPVWPPYAAPSRITRVYDEDTRDIPARRTAALDLLPTARSR